MKLPTIALPPASTSISISRRWLNPATRTRDEVIDDQIPNRAAAGDDQPIDANVTDAPFTPFTALSPTQLMIGVPAPGWVVPSIVTGSVIVGSADSGLIVCTPVPGMSKSIDWRPEPASALRIA